MDEEKLNDDLIQLVAYCARVSNPGNQYNNETADKLIKYLIKHQHWSPLEMASVCMEIDTTHSQNIHHKCVFLKSKRLE